LKHHRSESPLAVRKG